MLKAWLDSRSPRPPERLAQRIAAAIEPPTADSGDNVIEPMTSAAVRILEEIIDDQRNAESRSAALHLLAADALITYAIEAAAEACGDLAATADSLTARIAALAPMTSLPPGS